MELSLELSLELGAGLGLELGWLDPDGVTHSYLYVREVGGDRFLCFAWSRLGRRKCVLI